MGRPINILIVEDSIFLNHAFSSILNDKRPFPCRFYQAYSLKEARRILKTSRIDYIILDLILPDGSGHELIESIRDKNRTKVIVLSSLKDLGKREILYKMGILDYLSKDNPLPLISRNIYHLIEKIESNSGKTIMVIDDSPTVQSYISDIFTNRHYQVVKCPDATSALAALERSIPDLILLDLELLDIQGDGFLRQLKESELWTEVPVIVMTGSSDELIKLEIIKNGAEDIIEKPFSIEVIISKCENSIAIKESRDNMRKLSSTLAQEVEKMSIQIREKQEIINNQMRQIAMSEMISAITHQWMQPLSMIGLTCEDLVIQGMTTPLSAEDLKKFEEKIDQYIGYMKEVADSFKNFYKPLVFPSSFSILESIREIIHLLETRYIDIDIIIDGDSSIMITGYKNEFQQVIVNLLDNAKESMLNNYETPTVKIHLSVNDNRPVLTLQDNGNGIPIEQLETIFNPYVTSKENGNGIGLYISQKILAKIGARISAENITKGAQFTLFL